MEEYESAQAPTVSTAPPPSAEVSKGAQSITFPEPNDGFALDEDQEQGPNTTTFMTGFFDVHSDKKFRFLHYYIYNGTLSNYPEDLTMILQGKVLPKMS
ncbi:MAG: hypothetical protein ACRD5E_03205 [Nitrososphaeraceae archaeon]